MKMQITLENGNEKVTNLTIANEIIAFCENSCIKLNPRIVAKAILLQTENEVEK